MNKTLLTILVFTGVGFIYSLALIITTMIAVKLWGNVDPDDIDYSMTANVIQFFVVLLIIAEKVEKWIN